MKQTIRQIAPGKTSTTYRQALTWPYRKSRGNRNIWWGRLQLEEQYKITPLQTYI